MDLVPATCITEAHHMITLISYYRKLFPVFSDIVQPLNELIKQEGTIQMDQTMSKEPRLCERGHTQ